MLGSTKDELLNPLDYMTPRELQEEVRLDTVTDLSKFTANCLHGQSCIYSQNSQGKFLGLQNDDFDLVIDGDEGGIGRLGPTEGAMGQRHGENLKVEEILIKETRGEGGALGWCAVKRYYKREGAPEGLKK